MDDEELHFSPHFERVFSAIKRSRYIVIVFWMLTIVWGSATGGDYIKQAEDTANAPSGTRVEADYLAFQKYFPKFADEKVLILLIECFDKDCSVVCPASKCGKGCKGENAKLAAASEALAKKVLAMKGVTSYQSYYNFSGSPLDAAKCSFASVNGKTTFGSFSFANDATNPERHHVINTINKKFAPEMNPDQALYRISLTGFDVLAKEGSEDAILEVIRIDVFTMPVAFALLGYMVRSWRLLLLAGLNTGITMAFSFAFLGALSKVTGKKPLSTSSSLVEVLGLAMAIDYSLFLLRRFRDELKNKRPVEDAVKISLHNAGHVVVLSSLTFSCVFLGFLWLPSEDMQALAQACLVAILSALVICLTNTVSMIVAFPNFFSGEMRISLSDNPCRRSKSESDRIATQLYDALIVGDMIPPIQHHHPRDDSLLGFTPSPPPTASVTSLGRTVTGKLRHRRGAKYSGCYFTFLKFITRYPFNLLFVVIVYGCSVPIALRVLDLKHNQDVSQAIPRSAPSAKAFHNLSEAFPGGTLSPFFVIIESQQGQVANQETYSTIQTFVREMCEATDLDTKDVTSIATLQGKFIQFTQASQLLNQNSVLCKHMGQADSCALYQYLFGRFTSVDKSAALIAFTIRENPYSREGRRFIEDSMDVINRWESQHPSYRFHLSGDEVLLNADQDIAFGALPTILGTTIGIIFLLLGCGFRSIMTPIRLSLTVFLPLTTVFGFAVMVYQDGLLNWTGIDALKEADLGFFWYIPIVCLLQALGLTIDYDVFSFSRICEHRADGYEIRAAIIKAVWEVSSTICVAGLIMASVFSGLLLGSSTTVNQFGFLLCTSVLVDTFIVQSLLVPAIISVGDNFAWYPRQMPQDGLITLDDPEFST